MPWRFASGQCPSTWPLEFGLLFCAAMQMHWAFFRPREWLVEALNSCPSGVNPLTSVWFLSFSLKLLQRSAGETEKLFMDQPQPRCSQGCAVWTWLRRCHCPCHRLLSASLRLPVRLTHGIAVSHGTRAFKVQFLNSVCCTLSVATPSKTFF